MNQPFVALLRGINIGVAKRLPMERLRTLFIEASLKYEDIYLKGYADGREAKAGIGEYFAFYNERRLHQAHGYRAPMAVWRDSAVQTCGHVDNADALTTGPQAEQNQQQTEPLAA